MPERPTLIATVGLPRSGKSTWSHRQGVPVVNPDSIRLALHGRPFIEEAEPWVWLFARTMVRSLFLAGHATVILDATNVTRRRRREWIDRDWTLRFQVFPAPASLCIERALADGREYLVPVIERMAARFEPLDASEEELGPASPAEHQR